MDKQKRVLIYLNTVKTATLLQIYTHMDFGYYHNWKKHLGALMSRMVKNGTVVRVKKGEFKIAQRKKYEPDKDPRQLKMF
jgi:hypothetical protein